MKNKVITATLLSALVFPGAGHLYLRSYPRGIGLIAINTLALIDFIRRAWHEAELIRAQIIDEISASGVIDLETIMAHTIAAVHRIDSTPFTFGGGVLLVCWLVGVFDSYRISSRASSLSPEGDEDS